MQATVETLKYNAGNQAKYNGPSFLNQRIAFPKGHYGFALSPIADPQMALAGLLSTDTNFLVPQPFPIRASVHFKNNATSKVIIADRGPRTFSAEIDYIELDGDGTIDGGANSPFNDGFNTPANQSVLVTYLGHGEGLQVCERELIAIRCNPAGNAGSNVLPAAPPAVPLAVADLDLSVPANYYGQKPGFIVPVFGCRGIQLNLLKLGMVAPTAPVYVWECGSSLRWILQQVIQPGEWINDGTDQHFVWATDGRYDRKLYCFSCADVLVRVYRTIQQVEI